MMRTTGKLTNAKTGRSFSVTVHHEPKPIDTAPRDGTVVRVLHGPEPQQEATAYWSRSLQGWVLHAIESGLSTQQRVIHNVDWWLP